MSQITRGGSTFHLQFFYYSIILSILPHLNDHNRHGSNFYYSTISSWKFIVVIKFSRTHIDQECIIRDGFSIFNFIMKKASCEQFSIPEHSCHKSLEVGINFPSSIFLLFHNNIINFITRSWMIIILDMDRISFFNFYHSTISSWKFISCDQIFPNPYWPRMYH